MLKELDPEYFSVVDIHNHRRLLRAIDVIWQTNKNILNKLLFHRIPEILIRFESELKRQEKNCTIESTGEWIL